MKIISAEHIEKVANPGIWIDVMEKALLSISDPAYFTPDRMYVDMDSNTLFLMPSIGPNVFTTKLVSVFPGNMKSGKDVIQGTVGLGIFDLFGAELVNKKCEELNLGTNVKL